MSAIPHLTGVGLGDDHRPRFLFAVSGILDGDEVSGWEVAPDRDAAIRLARQRVGAKVSPGRPRRGQPVLRNVRADRAADS